jgi:hypothetical protein
MGPEILFSPSMRLDDFDAALRNGTMLQGPARDG